MNATVTIETVSKEVKNKISKLGKDALVKKFTEGKLQTIEEVAVAVYYLTQRQSLTTEQIEEVEAKMYVDLFFPDEAEVEYKEPTDEECGQRAEFGKHRSQMTESELAAAEDRHNKVVEANKAKSTIESVETQTDIVPEKKVKTTKEKTVKEKKPEDTPSVKLTGQEFKMFELITAQVVVDNPQLGQSVITQANLAEQIALGSLREFKGILSSLRKKQVVTYVGDNDIELTQLSVDMINGIMPYREKNKNERNFFKKERLTKMINDKEVDKSSYVRGLLRKNKNISYAEIKEALEKEGYPKLYHSELQRCRVQLGIEVKKQD